ncbi:glycosyltransferase family 4 protein [Clostridium perfringens]|uniref:glycosyltransferase family 4 protein n=1 Tax=Clostridium perfringens TaxID=1502 RepID=UPI0018E490B5|nr:glycosyltransferase family 4 protein [Clostridium perfringens]MBI5997584.1 glycosyltransferase family 4 protein [Clostridium perfringens]
MKNKILYVTNITRTVNTFFIPHMNMLVDEGYNVDCACKIDGEIKLDKKKINKKINFYNVPFTRNPLNFKNIIAFLKLYSLQKKNKYDFIHVHTPIASVYTRLLKRFFPSIKMIYTAHGYHFYKNSSKLSWIIYYNIEKYLSKYTDVLITINNEDYEVSKDFKCNRLIKMNGVGVDFSEFKEINENEKIKIRKSIGLEEDDFIIIMVGEHNKNKNQIKLIKTIQSIEEKYPKIKALFIGDGELIEENKEYINKNKIRNAKILGFKKNVNEFINSSDVLCSLSYREGLPKNVIEGLACGKVIIASNIRGNNELVKNGENGFVVYDDELEDIIINLYNLEKKDFKKMCRKSKELSKIYNLNNVLEDLKNIY